MNVLVTGGAGFIGSHIVKTLLERGDNVRVLDNFSTGKRENLIGLDVEIIEADLHEEPEPSDGTGILTRPAKAPPPEGRHGTWRSRRPQGC